MHERLAAAGLKLGQPDARWPRVEGRFPMERLTAVRLPPPFVQLALDTEPGADTQVRATAPLFMGVTLADAVAALTACGRMLPEPIIARLADWALDGLRALDEHPMAREWAGPFALGASLDLSLMLSLGADGVPLPPWRGPAVWAARGREFSVLSESFKALLTWAFSPWTLLGHPSPFSSGFKYAVVPEHLKALLSTPGWADVGYLQSTLRGAWSQLPRPSEREVALTLLAAAPEALRARAAAVPTSHCPDAWKGGGLEVLIDQVLEQGPTIDRYPRLPGVKHEFDGVDVSATERLAVVVHDAESQAVLGETILRKGASRTHIAAPFNCKRNSGPVVVELAHPAQRRIAVRVAATIENGWLHLAALTPEQARVVDGLFGLGEKRERPTP